MTRIADIETVGMNADQQRVFNAIAAGPRGKVEGPLRVWLHSPDLAERAQALGAFCRYGTTLSPKLNELAIITVGAFWKSGFEFAVHAPIAQSHGVSASTIEDIRLGRPPSGVSEEEAIVVNFVTSALRSKRVAPALYSAALQAFGSRGVVELVGVIGYYCLICLTINAFEVQAPGENDPFQGYEPARQIDVPAVAGGRPW